MQETQVQFLDWEDPLEKEMQPTPVFLPGESRDGEAWWAAVNGVAQSRTRLKWLSSSSSSSRGSWEKAVTEASRKARI